MKLKDLNFELLKVELLKDLAGEGTAYLTFRFLSGISCVNC